jgi:hypothetical protein
MAKCAQCGSSSLAMSKCEACSQRACANCSFTIFNTLYRGDDNYGNSLISIKTIFICKECWRKLAEELKSIFRHTYFEGPEQWARNCIYCGPNVDLSTMAYLSRTPFYKKVRGISAIDDYAQVVSVKLECQKCNRIFYATSYIFSRQEISEEVIGRYRGPDYQKYRYYSDAIIAEKVGRYEDAANYWEKAGFTEKAKSMRDSNRVIQHEHKHITIDGNRLVEMLGKTNYTIPYKCPGCGALIKLNKERSADNFLTCEYCNSSLKAIDIESLIKQMI